jgi:hypothetical protein
MENTKITTLNMTKFRVTSELEQFGVVDIGNWKLFQEVRNLLYFPVPPTQEQIKSRVERLSEIALEESKKSGATSALVSCPPWMMRALVSELTYHGIKAVFSFTKRDCDHGTTVVSLVEAA